MITLKEIILECLNNDESKLLDYGSGEYYKSLVEFSNSIQLYQLPQTLNLQKVKRFPQKLISMADILYHKEFIDILITFMLENEYPNALLLGFTSGAWKKSTNSTKFVSKGYNANIQLLKCQEMAILKTIVGSRKFVELILYWNAVYVSNGNLIWGYIKEMKFMERVQIINGVRMNRIMFLEEKNLKYCNPIDYDWFQNLALMFPQEFKPPTKIQETEINQWIKERKKRMPKRFRKLNIILKKMIEKHKRFEDKYAYTFESICSPPKKPYKKTDN